MKLFLASYESMHPHVAPHEHINFLSTFFSFYNFKLKKPKFELFRKMMKITTDNNKNLFLDSGAYGAWTRNTEIDVDAYIELLHEFKDDLWNYIQLDVKADKNNTVEQSIIKTKENCRIMEEAGLNPIPVYHAVTYTLPYLEELLEKYEFVMIGGMAGEKFNLKPTLDEIFALNFKYKRKLHALGQTNNKVFLNYPFYSADSTSWVHGGISNKLYYLQNYATLKSFNIKDPVPKEFFNENYLNINMVEGIKSWKERNLFNASIFHDLEYNLTKIWENRGVVWSA